MWDLQRLQYTDLGLETVGRGEEDGGIDDLLLSCGGLLVAAGEVGSEV